MISLRKRQRFKADSRRQFEVSVFGFSAKIGEFCGKFKVKGKGKGNWYSVIGIQYSVIGIRYQVSKSSDYNNLYHFCKNFKLSKAFLLIQPFETNTVAFKGMTIEIKPVYSMLMGNC